MTENNISKMNENQNIEDQIEEDMKDKENKEKGRKIPKLLEKIPVTLTLEVASAQISLADLMSLTTDSVIALDKMAGEPLDIKVNGITVGKGVVVVLKDKYGISVTELDQQNVEELTS